MNLDRLVVARGAAAGLLLVIPATVANGVLARQDDRSAGLSLLTILVVAIGFLVAGFSAGHERPDDARRHALASAVVALVPAEVVAVLGRLDRGAAISLFAIVITAFLAVGAGFTGGRLGAARKTRRSAP